MPILPSYFTFRTMQKYAFVFIGFVLSILLFACGTSNNSDKRYTVLRQKFTPLKTFKSFSYKLSPDNQLNSDEQRFKAGLEMMCNYEYSKAERIFLNLYNQTNNDTLQTEAAKIIFNILFAKSDWKKIREFDNVINKEIEDKDKIMVLAKAFSIAPKERIVFSQDTSVINWTKSPSGCPIIPCYINGRIRYFWFDTGANYSVISSDIAEECDVSPVIYEQSKARTGTIRKVNIYPAVVDSIRIGGVSIYNSPFVIVHDFDLKLRLFGSQNKTKIDGIIGWKIIQNLDLSIDSKHYTFTIRKPLNKQIARNDKNFFWLGCPFLAIKEKSGTPLIFGLDFGSEHSGITNYIFKKIAFEKIYTRVEPKTSVGGSIFYNSTLVSHLPIIISGHLIEFQNIATSYQVPYLFLHLDGIIGSDIMRNAIITLDIRNGIFKFEPYPND